jgi:hypothetical protein
MLDHWRRLHADKVLLAMANHAKIDPMFVPVKDAVTRRWHASVGTREFELLLTGPKFWDTRACVGGGGAIDLACHLFGCSFKAAIRRLESAGL